MRIDKKTNKLNKTVVRVTAICLCLFFAILCFLYGLKIRSAGYGTSFFLVWIFLAVFLLFLAWGIYIRLWAKLPKWARRVIVTVFLLGLSCFVWVEGRIISQMNDTGQKGLDYIIVLGALVYENGPSTVLASRLNTAIAYLNENPQTICIASGGQGANEPFSEAEGMKRYLLQNGIDASRILLEPDSKNTIANIKNSHKLISGPNAKVGLVTSNFHVYRSCKIARKQGISNISGISADSVPFYLPSNMLREFLGIIKDTLAGNM